MATLNQNVITNLENAYGAPFVNNIKGTLENSLELTSMLNLFVNRNGKFAKLAKGGGADYLARTKTIRISLEDKSGDLFYLALAHELGHATGFNQAAPISELQVYSGKPTTYKTAISYANSFATGEAEAIVKEHVVAKELNLMKTFSEKYDGYIGKMLENNTTHTVMDILNDKVKNNKNLPLTKKQKIEIISNASLNMIPSGQGDAKIRYTYDEKNIAWYISVFTNIQADYKEVIGNFLFPIVQDNNGDTALNLHDKSSNIYRIKSLTNRNNKFFSHNREDTDNTNDTLENKIGLASEAQKKGQHDVMYGGRGNDTITGAAGKEIILGGDGVDKLYGMGGDDILGGNIGDDHLYGGTGNDTLKGGQGMDTYYFEANDINNPKERDTINDSDNQGKILISNVDIAKAKWVNKGNGIWQAADQKWQLKQVGSNWEITGMNGSSLKSTIIVQNATKTVNAFGLTLPKAATAAPRVAMATEHAFLANSISAANNLISAMSAFGVDNMGVADDLNARSTQYHAPLLAASAI